jgi:hypothetical protein
MFAAKKTFIGAERRGMRGFQHMNVLFHLSVPVFPVQICPIIKTHTFFFGDIFLITASVKSIQPIFAWLAGSLARTVRIAFSRNTPCFAHLVRLPVLEWAYQYLVQFFINIYQRRRRRHTIGNGKTEPMRLPGAMIRILAEYHHFYLIERGCIKCIEDQLNRADTRLRLLLFLFSGAWHLQEIWFGKFMLQHFFPAGFDFYIHV